MNVRLHPTLLPQLPAAIQRPTYERCAHGIGIVHLGIGAFHRAHQAAYIDSALALHGGNWRILGVSMRSATVREQLQPQDCLYTKVERSAAGDQLRIIGSIADVLVAPQDPSAVIAAMVRPETQIISLTITEKGYCRDSASGALDRRHPDVLYDFDHPEQPRGAMGFLIEALRQRRQRRLPPPTLLCCDNLPHNGAVLRRLLLEFASERDAALAAWIEQEVACPSTMVDRIVPATTAEDIAAISTVLGVRDEALVKTEPFTQWVIEDRFCSQRPALENVGALIVSDVRPFETAKLRLLNGSHSTLAYLGHLAGFAYVHEAVADPEFLRLLRMLMAEITPTLDPAPGLDFLTYQSSLLARFGNPALAHRLLQIAMDGSQKLPQRLLAPIAIRLQRGEGIDVLALGVAAWMRHVSGQAEGGRTHAVDDPLASRLTTVAGQAGNHSAALVDGLLGIEQIFGRDLPANSAFRDLLVRHVAALMSAGARATVHGIVTR